MNSKIAADWSPKAWLRSRRPELFSDSAVHDVPEIDRSVLEFQLDSLTSRSQEADFERFARRLCSYEVCPNLLPQTGPTGGGDSKVDSETYPVAEQLALTWHVGHGTGANSERWAFAFSTKKKWRPKVEDDISKLVATGRGYKKAFYVSNQAIAAKKRAEVEDKLSKELGLEVRILDRTWILDRVFSNSRQHVAIEELRVTGLQSLRRALGPHDASRETIFSSKEKALSEAIANGAPTLADVDAALEIAILARELDRPASDIRGLFDRADTCAVTFGTPRQQVEVAYERARTEFWWHEQLTLFRSAYAVVEQRVLGSRNAHDLQELANLWMLLDTEVFLARLDEADHQERTATLTAELERVVADKNRPSASLQAESIGLMMRLSRCIKNKELPDEILVSLAAVVERSADLPGFPLEHFTKPLVGLGQVLEGNEQYGTLFERIVDVQSSRRGEVEAARLLLKRGEGQMEANLPVEAISTLGRALARLHKHETRNDAARALYLTGIAYESIGLPWAARGTLVFAASLATDSYWEYGDITNAQVHCFRRLKWLEYRLGRVPQLLCWHEMHMAAQHHAPAAKNPIEAEAESVKFETLLGRLFLRTTLSQLKTLSRLPDALDALDLPVAAAALEYALGHERRMAEMVQELGSTVEAHCAKWRDLTSEPPSPDRPELGDGKQVTLQSRVMGCRVTAVADMTPPCVEVAESVLAVLESFLATSMMTRAMCSQHSVTIRVEIAELQTELIRVGFEESSGTPVFSVTCQTFDPYHPTQQIQSMLSDAIFDAITQIVPRMVVFKDAERDLEELFRDERVADRALGFAGNLGGLPNVLGSSPKTTVTSWSLDASKTYPLLRTAAWDEHIPPKLASPMASTNAAEGGFDLRRMAHDELETSPLMRLPLWEAARWMGAFFMIDETYANDPVLGLIFLNPNPGLQIFRHWQAELGDEDKEDRLRIAAVTGIDSSSPNSYRMIVSPNPAAILTGGGVAQLFSRLHRMDPASSDNLTRFFAAFRGRGRFQLVPAYMDGSRPKISHRMGLRLNRFHLRKAWEIDCNDFDAVGIRPEDSPMIPDHATGTAPVLRRLAKIRQEDP